MIALSLRLGAHFFFAEGSGVFYTYLTFFAICTGLTASTVGERHNSDKNIYFSMKPDNRLETNIDKVAFPRFVEIKDDKKVEDKKEEDKQEGDKKGEDKQEGDKKGEDKQEGDKKEEDKHEGDKKGEDKKEGEKKDEQNNDNKVTLPKDIQNSPAAKEAAKEGTKNVQEVLRNLA